MEDTPTTEIAQTRDSLVEVKQQLDALTAKVEQLVETQEAMADLARDAAPIAKDAIGIATQRLAELESRGYFEMGREILDIVDRFAGDQGAEALHSLGENLHDVVDVARNATHPDVLHLADGAVQALQAASAAEPVGMMGLMRATREDDVQMGLAAVLEVLRQVGRTARKAELTRPAGASSRPGLERLAARRRRAIARDSGRTKVAKEAGRPSKKDRRPAGATPGDNGTDTSKPPLTLAQSVIATLPQGIELTADGHLANPDAWTRELAVTLATSLGIEELTDTHWQVIEFARSDFKETGKSPNIRRITKGSGVSTKDLYTLFQKAPGRAVSRIAGIPKPVGCI